MKKWLLSAGLAVAVFHVAQPAWAQFTDAHSYDNTPAGTNQVELAYSYVQANASLDTALIISGAMLDLNQGMISYACYFGLFHRLM
jgi:hypothetical protein